MDIGQLSWNEMKLNGVAFKDVQIQIELSKKSLSKSEMKVKGLHCESWSS